MFDIEHRDDGTVLLIQPKLLQKLFKKHPEKIGNKRKAGMPLHPYGPAPAHNATTSKEQSPPIKVTTYLRLLGLFMYLTKSRPDIMTAVSFGLLSPPVLHRMITTNYTILRATADKGRRIYIGTSGAIQLYCEVDANYLILIPRGILDTLWVYIPMVPSTTEVPNRLWYRPLLPMLRCVHYTHWSRTYSL